MRRVRKIARWFSLICAVSESLSAIMSLAPWRASPGPGTSSEVYFAASESRLRAESVHMASASGPSPRSLAWVARVRLFGL